MIKSIIPLSSIVALRFFGLFLVLPVISIYAINFTNSSTFLIGIAVGCYALTQMIFQVPFGMISDKLGRKSTIIIGLIIFIIGSIICAISSNIYILILGRLLQGAGAISAVVTAMISDIVKEEQRPKAMAIMGASIALSFAIAMLAGPSISSYFGMSSLFNITAILTIISIYILIKYVPNPPKISHKYQTKTHFSIILKDKNLIKMNITNFLQKGFMTFAFMIIPIILIQNFNWDLKELYKVYTPSMLFGLLAMGPATILAQKKGKYKEVLIVGILLFAISFLTIGNSTSSIFFIIGVVIFFIGFNTHEPIMQSLATKFAKVHQRGLVLGVFNSFGYLGTFLGGLLGGIFFENTPISTIVLYIAIICILWIALIYTIPNPMNKKIVYINIDTINKSKIENLNQNKHIDEWYINETENTLVIKYDMKSIDENSIKEELQL